MLSYSMSVKQNLLSGLDMRPNRIKMVILGVTQAMARMISDETGRRILFTSENTALIRQVKLYLEREVGIGTALNYNKSIGPRTKKRVSLTVSEVEAFLSYFGLQSGEGEIGLEIAPEVFKNPRRSKDYIIGFFLASGFIAHPKKNYHMEFVCRTEAQAADLLKLLSTLSFHLKTVKRLSSFVVYVKDSDTIADLLSSMDAITARLAFEDEKIMKQIMNNVNRLVNCETANIEKSSEASVRQVNAIKYIDQTIGLYQLDEKLRTAAQLRLAEPNLNLKELGLLMTPPLGKSGMNHRMSKLEEIASNLRKRQGQHIEKNK